MKLPIIVGLLALLAVTGVAMHTTNFTAYLGDDPAACNNCHIMDTTYESWYRSGHAKWATCNECHTPHQLIPKYIVKADAGFRHVSAFVLGHIPPAIRAREASRRIIQENCIYCHQPTVEDIIAGPMDFNLYCFECHREVAHGPRGIALSPSQQQ